MSQDLSNFAKIHVGTYFKVKGQTYRKVDPLNYVSASAPGIDISITPMFDAQIEVPGQEKEAGSSERKFIIDPQTRVVVPNPGYKYRTAEQAFAELWGSALFNCGPNDYQFMVEHSIEAVKAFRPDRSGFVA